MPPKVTPSFDTEFLIEVKRGNIPGASLVTKFGCVSNASTSALTPCCNGGFYQTPTTIQALEIVSDDTNDTSAGTGARKILIQGLSTSYAEVSETVTMNGTTAVALANSYFRVYRLYVTESGTYATSSSSSQKGTITLQGTGGGVTWAVLAEAIAGFGVSQSQIGMYTIPPSKTAYLISQLITIESTKTANFFFFQRQNIDDVTTPFTGIMRLVNQYDGIGEPLMIVQPAPITSFPEKTDVGFFVNPAANGTSISVEFQLLLIDD